MEEHWKRSAEVRKSRQDAGKQRVHNPVPVRATEKVATGKPIVTVKEYLSPEDHYYRIGGLDDRALHRLRVLAKIEGLGLESH